MTIWNALRWHMPPRIKQLLQNRLATSHRWIVAKAGIRPGQVVAVVASAAEAARLPSDVRRKVRAAQTIGHAVELYILDFDLNKIPQGFSEGAIRRFWIDAAPVATDDVTHGEPPISSDLSEAPYPLPVGKWTTGYYDNGQPVLFVTRHPGGERLEHLGAGGQPLQRDEFDQNGRLVRRIDVDPATGRAAVHRYVDSSGRSWLWVAINADGKTGPVWQLHPQIRNYESLAHVQAAWLRQHLGQTDRAAVLAGGATSDSIIQRALV